MFYILLHCIMYNYFIVLFKIAFILIQPLCMCVCGDEGGIQQEGNTRLVAND